jgi:hypothetical protein
MRLKNLMPPNEGLESVSALARLAGSALDTGCARATIGFMLLCFHQNDSNAWTLYSSDLVELMKKPFIMTHQMCGMDSVLLLSHSFYVRQMVSDTN